MVAGTAIQAGLSKVILGPIRQLTAATAQFAAGELDTAVPVRTGDEIGALGTSFR